MKEEFAGHLSRVMWDGTDVQLQTEIRYKPEPRAQVIFVADGVIISRVEKPWNREPNATKEHNNIREFHKRLTRAMHRLADKAYIELDQLKKVTVRLVNAALHMESPRNRADDALSLIPGASWTAIIAKKDGALEQTPDGSAMEGWIKPMQDTIKVATQLTALFEADELSDISLKTSHGFILAADGENEILLTHTSKETMPVARQMMLRLQKTLLQ